MKQPTPRNERRRGRANVRWLSNRQKGKRKRRRSPRALVGLRLNDLGALFRWSYGITLPDDDAGRDDLFIAVNHLAGLPQPHKAITNWVEIWAPWLGDEERDAIIDRTVGNRQVWKADELGQRLRLTKEVRKMLGITTIGAIDETKAERMKQRRAYQREHKTKVRRAKGATPRSESKSARKPWVAEGVSRASWYRQQRRLRQPETTSASA